MKVSIINHKKGECSECFKPYDEAVELYFCSNECVDKFKKWVIDNLMEKDDESSSG